MVIALRLSDMPSYLKIVWYGFGNFLVWPWRRIRPFKGTVVEVKTSYTMVSHYEKSCTYLMVKQSDGRILRQACNFYPSSAVVLGDKVVRRLFGPLYRIRENEVKRIRGL